MAHLRKPTGSERNICVCVRIRPPTTNSLNNPVKIGRGGEIYQESGFIKWKWDDQHILCAMEDSDKGNEYTFRSIYGPEVQTPSIFEDIAKPIVHNTFNGYNGCIFAYGQTNSGKTYTIHGDQIPGIIPLAVIEFFKLIKETRGRVSILRVSYLEIYNEQLKDLLSTEPVNLQIQDHPERGVIVVGLSEMIVSSLEQILRLLAEGEERRMMGRNNVHLHASRSHTVFQLILESRDLDDNNVRISTLNLVDLAGSESSYTNAEPTPEDVLETMKQSQNISARAANLMDRKSQQDRPLKEREGRNIRKSLLSLVRVVNTLSAGKNQYIPYRDSKLTRILQPALGGNANTSVICTVNPVEFKETSFTLRFATSAQRITNKPKVVNIMSHEGLLNKYQSDLQDLREEIEIKEKEKTNVFDRLCEEKHALENVYSQKLQAQAAEKSRLEKNYWTKVREEEQLRNTYQHTLQVSEASRRQYENLSKFLLSSRPEDVQQAIIHQGAYEVSRSDTSSPVHREGWRPRWKRRHSIVCLRDRHSKSLFVQKEELGESSNCAAYDTLVSRMSTAPEFSTEAIVALRGRVNQLEAMLQQRSSNDEEVHELHQMVDQYEFQIQKEQERREAFYESLKDTIMDLPVENTLKHVMSTLLTNVHTISASDAKLIKGMLESTAANIVANTRQREQQQNAATSGSKQQVTAGSVTQGGTRPNGGAVGTPPLMPSSTPRSSQQPNAHNTKSSTSGSSNNTPSVSLSSVAHSQSAPAISQHQYVDQTPPHAQPQQTLQQHQQQQNPQISTTTTTIATSNPTTAPPRNPQLSGVRQYSGSGTSPVAVSTPSANWQQQVQQQVNSNRLLPQSRENIQFNSGSVSIPTTNTMQPGLPTTTQTAGPPNSNIQYTSVTSYTTTTNSIQPQPQGVVQYPTATGGSGGGLQSVQYSSTAAPAVIQYQQTSQPAPVQVRYESPLRTSAQGVVQANQYYTTNQYTSQPYYSTTGFY